MNSSAITHRCGVPAGMISTSPLAMVISLDPSASVPPLPMPLPALVGRRFQSTSFPPNSIRPFPSRT